MKGYKEPSLRDRQRTTRERKKSELEKFQKHVSDPALGQRLADRAARGGERTAAREVTAARRAHEHDREVQVAKDIAVAAADAAKQAAEAAADAAKQAAEAAARTLEEQSDRQLAEAADQKAGRDARYAARKARQKRR